MLKASDFFDLVSGRRRGFAATAIRGALRVAETPYSLAVGVRNWRFDRGHTAVVDVGVPVVSVGNMTLGGTGKTPFVKWVVRRFMERGLRPAIVSRGYGATNGRLNDEARELAQSLPETPHVQNPDRVAAAQKAISDIAADIIVLDDGFQHRRLARRLDIVLLDALEPFGFGHVFPRGTLREPLEGIGRAGVVCLSRADLVSAERRDEIRKLVAKLAPGAAWCAATHAPSGLINAARGMALLSTLQGKRVAAFCALGNPAGFRHTLELTGCQIVAWREFPDHHMYTPADREELAYAAQSSSSELLVCTQKDLVKIERNEIGGQPLWALAIDMRFVEGEETLSAKLENVIATRR